MKVSTNATPKSYNAYGPWLREKFGGKRVFKVIVDAGFTCPNRDGSKGYGGCTYCNVDSFTPSLPRSLDDIRAQVLQGIVRARETLPRGKVHHLFPAEHQHLRPRRTTARTRTTKR